jgi:hypothetical protein
MVAFHLLMFVTLPALQVIPPKAGIRKNNVKFICSINDEPQDGIKIKTNASFY